MSADPATLGGPHDTDLADGEWHRLHPATPLLRGGFVLIAILAWVLAQEREQLANLLLGGHQHGDGGDPIVFLTSHGRLPLALGGVALLLIILIAIFYASWRVHTFRITAELVEVRSGILRRVERKGRLDRIQGVNIVRPWFARLFGAARLEIDVAGHDANVRLDYLSSSNADALRLDILRMASGIRQRERERSAPPSDLAPPTGMPAAYGPPTQPGLLDQRFAEFTAPELDPNLAPPESVVKMHVGRLIGSLALHDTTLTMIIVLLVIGGFSLSSGHLVGVIAILPFLFGIFRFLWRRFTKSLRYSIAATPDGVRVGFGVLTLSNETLPPGRIHSVEVRQPVLWRFPRWWEVRVNRASKSNARGADGQRNTTILPVGNVDDVVKVLGLLLPGMSGNQAEEIIRRGITGRGPAGGFTVSPGRAFWVRPLAFRRNGFARLPGLVLLRQGASWRRLTVVPEARVQSLAVRQGPLYRALRLVHLHVHTVNGPIRADLGAVDQDVALQFFAEESKAVVQAVASDRTHRWREDEATA